MPKCWSLFVDFDSIEQADAILMKDNASNICAPTHTCLLLPILRTLYNVMGLGVIDQINTIAQTIAKSSPSSLFDFVKS